jgi:branched-chain amino acid transport system substrate-binding protein
MLLVTIGGLFTNGAYAVELPPTLKFGILIAITGGQARWGEWTVGGCNIAVDEINSKGGINGKSIEVIIGDDKMQPAQSNLLAKKLATQDKVLAAYTTGTGVSLADSPIFEKYKVCQLAFAFGTGLTQRGGRFIFRVSPNTDVQNASVVNYMVKERGAKKFAILRDSAEYGEESAKSYKKALEANGLAPLAVEVFNLGDKDFTGQLLRIKNVGAEVLIVATTDIDSATIIRQVKLMNLPLQPIGNESQKSGNVTKILGRLVDGLIVSASRDWETFDDPRAVEFKEKYENKYGKIISTTPFRVYDVIHLFKLAVERAWPNIAGEGLRQGFLSISTQTPFAKGAYKGIVQTYDYDETGEACKTMELYRYNENGKLVPLSK